MIKKPHSELTLHEKQKKLLYLNELLEKDEGFDLDVRRAMKRALKRCPELSKLVPMSEMQEHEKLDINNPIEQK